MSASATAENPATPTMHKLAIHRNVLVVARERIEGTWKAYVVPVPGKNHDQEAIDLWRDHGAQLTETQARAFFPKLADKPYAA